MQKIELPAIPENLDKFIEFISESAKEKGFSEHRVKEIELVTEEVLVNIFSYAYEENPGRVKITHKEIHDRKLILEILDYGVPFDPLSLSKPELSSRVSDRNVGGLGIFFTCELADDVQYHRDEDTNVLTLTFS